MLAWPSCLAIHSGDSPAANQKVAAPSFYRWLEEHNPSSLNRTSVYHSNNLIFSEDEKKNAVVNLCARDTSAKEVANKLGVSRQVLYKWKDKFLSPEQSISMSKKHDKPKQDSPSSLGISAHHEELLRLKKQLYELQLEHDILTKANEIIKKDQGINNQKLTNKEKTLLIDALLSKYSLKNLLSQLQLARSTYFYQKVSLNKPSKYADVIRKMTEIFNQNHQCYGYRRIQVALQQVGVSVAEKVIRRLQKEASLIPFSSNKRRNYSSYYGEISPPVENIVSRNFSAPKPNQKWLTDITEFRIAAGKIYLSPIIDCFDGMVVSWSLGTRPTANLVNNMLDKAILHLDEQEKPIINSDRGAHYRWPGWIERMEKHQLTRSMSKKGCSPDNAACEGFFGRLKTEFFYQRDWHTTSIEQFIESVNDYINWYNKKRIKLSLDSKSPIEYRIANGYLTKTV